MVLRSFSLIAAIALAGALSSCGGGATLSVADLYRGDIEQVLTSSSSEYVKGILSDFLITDEEYFQAKTRYVQCSLEDGVYVSVIDGEVNLMLEGNSGKTSVDAARCGDDFSPIFELYRNMKTNPEKIDLKTATVECMKSKDLVPSDYTTADFEQDSKGYPLSGGGLLEPLWRTGSEKISPFKSCVYNPLGLDMAL